MELWTLRREDKGTCGKNSPGIDPCRPSDFLTQMWGSLFKAPLYSPNIWYTPTNSNNEKRIDTGLTSGPPWGDGAEEAGEQQEQGHLSDPAARNRVEILLTLFFLCSFFEDLGENSLWTLRERLCIRAGWDLTGQHRSRPLWPWPQIEACFPLPTVLLS